MSEQNPLYRLLYVPEVESADLVGPGRVDVELSTHYSSIFEEGAAESFHQMFDLEQMSNALTVRYGITESAEVGGQVALVTGWDGFLDALVTGFHETLGLPNGGREDQPEDRYAFELEHFDGESGEVVLDIEDRTLSLEDVRLFGRWQFTGGPDEPNAGSLQATARVAGGPFDGGRLSGGASIAGRFSRDRTHIHLGAGLAVLNPPRELRAISRDVAFFMSHGLEREIGSSLSFLAQLAGNSSYFHGFRGADLHGFPMILTVGLGGRFRRDWRWKLGFSEDILFGGPSVDFTVGLQISRGFQPGA